MDAVYLVREGPNEELRYSLRSLANVPHDRVWIIGGAPGWVRNVELIPTRQGKNRFDNTLRGWMTACTHPGISESFVLWNDDFFALAPTIPEYRHRGLVEMRSVSNVPDYRSGKILTAQLCQKWGRPSFDYSTHTPFPVVKDLGREVLEKAASHQVKGLNRRVLYGNYWQVGGDELGNVGIGSQTELPKPGEVWVATNDRSFATGAVGQMIRDLYPEPSRYEEAGCSTPFSRSSSSSRSGSQSTCGGPPERSAGYSQSPIRRFDPKTPGSAVTPPN